MGLRINSNTTALQAQRQTQQTTNRLLQGLQQRATLQRINQAADDAAGLAISENLRSQIRQLGQEVNNLQSGVNVAQTAEGALGTQQDALQRARELALQAANGTLTDDQRAALNQEAQQLLEQVDATAASTEFNGRTLIDGSAGTIDLGTEGDLAITLEESTTDSLGIAGVDISTQAGAASAVDQFDAALDQISQNRAALGAQSNRFETAISQRETETLNQQEAESRIRDADVARLAIEQSRNEILLNAGVAALTQSNITPQVAAQLLGG
jgi:flagellin